MRVVPSVLIAALLLSASPRDARSADAIHPGAVELRMRASVAHETLEYDDEDVGSRTDAEAGLAAGLFLTRWFELGVGFGYNYTKFDPEEGTGSWDRSSIVLAPEIVLNAPSAGPIVPYVSGGGGVGFYTGDWAGDKTGMILPRFEGGIRWFAAEGAAIHFAGVYSRWTNRDGDEDAAATHYAFIAGISIFP